MLNDFTLPGAQTFFQRYFASALANAKHVTVERKRISRYHFCNDEHGGDGYQWIITCDGKFFGEYFLFDPDKGGEECRKTYFGKIPGFMNQFAVRMDKERKDNLLPTDTFRLVFTNKTLKEGPTTLDTLHPDPAGATWETTAWRRVDPHKNIIQFP